MAQAEVRCGAHRRAEARRRRSTRRRWNAPENRGTDRPSLESCAVRQAKGLIERDRRLDRKEVVDLRKLDAWKTVQRYPSGFRFPGGESFAEMQSRAVDATHELVAAHPGETIVAVSMPT